jgi:hypothetical protein
MDTFGFNNQLIDVSIIIEPSAAKPGSPIKSPSPNWLLKYSSFTSKDSVNIVVTFINTALIFFTAVFTCL